ncbi:hypothetical protein MRX96_002751 [Rhipicephalus microplus]
MVPSRLWHARHPVEATSGGSPKPAGKTGGTNWTPVGAAWAGSGSPQHLFQPQPQPCVGPTVPAAPVAGAQWGPMGGRFWVHSSGAIPATADGSTAPHDGCGGTWHVRCPGTCTEQPASCQRPFWRPLKLQVRTVRPERSNRRLVPAVFPPPEVIYV